MNEALNRVYRKYPEPIYSLLLACRDIVLSADSRITESLSHSAPFFRIKNKTVCYFWVDKKTEKPYIGFPEGYRIEHPLLHFGKRKRIKSMWIDPHEDIPKNTIKMIVIESVELIEKG
jgi:hypothetical protein